MVKFTVEQVRAIMDKKKNIRNMCVIAHVDHGKSTLTDSLIAAAGIISEHSAGDARYMDNRPDEQERGITIKSTGVTLYYDLPDEKVPPGSEGNSFLVNLIDSPGHVDFSSEVTAALRVTDGALVVVDSVEGVSVQTETVLRQALAERIKPVLMVNKVDRLLLELQLDPETAYQSFSRTIEKANEIISTYEDSVLGDVQVSPSLGTVAFGSGLHGWAFTLTRFADIYAKKFGIDRERMMTKLWGENYWDPETKTWIESPISSSGAHLKRGFVQYVLDPIYRLFDAIRGNDIEKVDKMLESLEIVLKPQERELEGKALLKAVMKKFLPAHEALLEMIVSHLPSPATAQVYRAETLYEGPMEDDAGRAIRECDPKGPLMLYISKMVPSPDRGRFYAFGRVFSGTVHSGQRVRIMGANYVPGKKGDEFHKGIQRVVLMMGRTVDTVGEVPCGNTVALVGIDDVLVKSGTVTTSETAFPLRAMKFSVSPVVRVAVDVKVPAELPKLVDGLKSLSKSDPLVHWYFDDSTSQYIVEGAGELHLEIALKDLAEFCGIELKTQDPVVSFRESIASASASISLAKSANKHNRLYLSAEPINKLTDAIENKSFEIDSDDKTRAALLVQEHGWSPADAKKIWTFGPDDTGPNVFVDVTKGVQGLDDIRDSVLRGFDAALREGVLCGEPVRGIRVNIHDAMIHSDPPHRSPQQITPAAKRAVYASMLSAQPVLLEPVYLVDIVCPQDAVGGVYSVVSRRRGHVISEEPRIGTPLVSLKAHLPVLESFGFTAALRSQTSGKAFPQAVFDHWQPLPGNPLEPGTKANQVALEVRKRKDLKAALPTLDQFLDKL